MFCTNNISHHATIYFQSPSLSPTSSLSPTLSFCTITEGYSNGSAGNLTIVDGELVLIQSDGSTSSFSSILTIGTADTSVTTIIEDINYFIIPAGQTVNVLGTVEIKAVGVDIQEGATLNGNGGGYAGGARRTPYGQSGRKNGSSPPNTNGRGQGGYDYTGGAGAGHGKLIHLLRFNST